MPDFHAGQNLSDISASGLGRAFAAGDWFVRNKQLAEQLQYSALTRETDIVKVKNSIGADIEKGDVIEINPSDLVIDEVTNRFLWFSGEGVLAERGFGIARNPIPFSEIKPEIGEIQVSGVCKAKLILGDSRHQWARPKMGQVELESGFYGPCFILHQGADDDGVNDATVVIAQPQRVICGKINLTEDMCSVENAHLDVETWIPYKNGPFCMDLPIDLIPTEAINAFGREAQAGDTVLIVYDGEEDEWEVWVVTPHQFTFGGLVTVDTDLMKIFQDTLAGVVETCEQAQTIEVADLTDCPTGS